MRFAEDDGGRAAAGFSGRTGDCVTRAVAIATGLLYQDVYDHLHAAVLNDRRAMARLQLRYGAQARRHASPRAGVGRAVYQPYLETLGWEWQPTMQIGAGCKVHLLADELPTGRIITRLSKHLCAVIDGVIHDTYNPSRDGTRCVYGYFHHAGQEG